MSAIAELMSNADVLAALGDTPDDVADFICRVCAVEHRVAREKPWSKVGVCSCCGEMHVLYKMAQSVINVQAGAQ